MTDRLDEVARAFNAARTEAAEMRRRLKIAQQTVIELRPRVNEAIVSAVRSGRAQIEISRLTGYTPERIRQICREADAKDAARPDTSVEPSE